MSLIVADRVKETTTTTSTGTLTLAGAIAGFQAFSSVCASGDTAYYCIAHRTPGEWEVGIGTYSSGTLSRDEILASSNAGSGVSLSGGTKDVFLTHPSRAMRPARGEKTATIAAATFKAAFSSPVVLVAGSTGVWTIPYILNFRKASGTAYVLNGNTNLAFRWTNGSIIANNGMAGLFDTTSTTYFVARYTSNLANSTILNPTIIGAGLDLKLDTADMVTGTGDVTVTVSYDLYTIIP